MRPNVLVRRERINFQLFTSVRQRAGDSYSGHDWPKHHQVWRYIRQQTTVYPPTHDCIYIQTDAISVFCETRLSSFQFRTAATLHGVCSREFSTVREHFESGDGGEPERRRHGPAATSPAPDPTARGVACRPAPPGPRPPGGGATRGRSRMDL